MYELKRTQQVDDSANILIQLAHSRADMVHFAHDGFVSCYRCGGFLDAYYCENRTYAVRCKLCKTITLVKAGNPGEAVRRVGFVQDAE